MAGDSLISPENFGVQKQNQHYLKDTVLKYTPEQDNDDGLDTPLVQMSQGGSKNCTETPPHEIEYHKTFDAYNHPSNFGVADHFTGNAPRKYTPREPFNVAERASDASPLNDGKRFGTKGANRKENAAGPQESDYSVPLSKWRVTNKSKRGYGYRGANQP